MPKNELIKQEEKKWITNPEKWITLKSEKTFRENAGEIFDTNHWPSTKYKRWKILAEKLAKDKANFSDEDNKELTSILLSINTTKHHRLLMETMGQEQDMTGIAEFAEDLIKEYDCTWISERALCESVALAYFSTMKISRQINRQYNFEYYSNERNNYIATLSKELEKQNRMYLVWLQTLRTLKSPFWGMKINAKNAFIGENQQFNNNPITPWENQ